MTSYFCENVKAGFVAFDDFSEFLKHVCGCRDCQRRIYARFIVEFKQKETGDK